MKKRRSFSNTKRLFGRVFNVRAMTDYNRIKYYLKYIGDLAKTYFVPQSKKGKETFDEAKMRLHVTEDELLVKQHALLRLSILMLVAAGLFLMYAVYQFIYGSILGFIPTCAIFAVALALAFRYHFWYFQIKTRKLGCTFAEWRRRNLKDEAQ